MPKILAVVVLSLAALGVLPVGAQQADQYIDNGCYGCPVVWHGWSDDGYAHWTNTCYNGYGCDGWVLVYP